MLRDFQKSLTWRRQAEWISCELWRHPAEKDADDKPWIVPRAKENSR